MRHYAHVTVWMAGLRRDCATMASTRVRGSEWPSEPADSRRQSQASLWVERSLRKDLEQVQRWIVVLQVQAFAPTYHCPARQQLAVQKTRGEERTAHHHRLLQPYWPPDFPAHSCGD